MATNNLDAEAFPVLDEGQMAGLATCPMTPLHQFSDGGLPFAIQRPSPTVLEA
jgi:hypothetical protein